MFGNWPIRPAPVMSAIARGALAGALCLSSPWSVAWGRDGHALAVWQTEQGLPNNGVQAILQTADGYLWVGTSRGLARFDGVRFTVLTPGNEPALNSERIWRLCPDRRGGFWLADDAGGLCFWRNGRLQRFSASAQEEARRIFSMCCDREDRLWTVTLEGEVACVEGGQVRQLGRPGQGAVGPSCLAADLDGTVWLASRGSLGYFRSNTWVSVAENLAPPLEIAPRRAGGLWLVAGQRIHKVQPGGSRREVAALPWPADDTNARQLLEDRRGTLWIGTSRRGLLALREGSGLRPVPTSHQSILALYEDREGSLWVGTQGGGLNRIRETPFEVFDVHSGLPSDIIHSLAEDRSGRMWLVPQSGGLTFLSNGVWHTLPPNLPFGTQLLGVAPVADGGVWITTIYDGLIYWREGQTRSLTPAEGLAGPRVDALLEDRQRRLWIGYHAEGLGCLDGTNLVHYTTADGLPGTSIRALAEDGLNRLWVGTLEGGLARWSEGRLEAERLPPGIGAVNAIVPLEDGTLWLGTLSGGLVRVRPGWIARVSTSHGLPDDFVANILPDDSGNFWCGSSKGLFRVSLRDLNAVADGRASRLEVCSYGRSDGLPDFTFPGTAHPSAWRARDGRLWFASAKGAVALDPGRVELNREPPPVWIEEIRCQGRPVHLTDVAEMPAGHRDWQFSFTALSLVAPEKVRFRHRLLGYDADWVEAGASRQVRYEGLPPGNYRFQVIACNNDGVWNEAGASFRFTIAPYVWESPWFPAVTATVGIGLLALTARWVVVRRLRRRIALLEQQHLLEKERTRIARDIHDELGASLTRIGLLADLAHKCADRPAEVATDLRQIAATARQAVQAMDAIVWAVNPRNDSVEKFADYLSNFAESLLRPANIRCRLEVPADVPAHPLGTEARHNLFLAAKEALNNIVKHAAATEVWIRLSCSAGELRVCIEDNGCGLPTAPLPPGSDGLLNIHRRIENLGGQVTVASEPTRGTRLTIRLPLNLPSSK